MTIQITGKNLDIGPAYRTYVQDKILRRLEKYTGQELKGHVRLEKEGLQFRTNCSLTLASGLQLQSNGESEDAYASADIAVEKLEKRLRRYTRRLKEHHGRTNGSAPFIEAADHIVAASDNENNAEPSEHPVIIAEGSTAVRTSSVSDAVMQLDLSENTLVLFRNAGNGRLNIVYRRPDGNIGWIDPPQDPIEQ